MISTIASDLPPRSLECLDVSAHMLVVPVTRRHRQAIDITPPAVPSANDCAYEPSVGLRHEEDGGGLGEELEDLLAVVGGARSRLRLSPQGENLLGLVGPRGTDGGGVGHGLDAELRI